MTKEEIENRVIKAKELFLQGFNCSQSVFASCADLYGMDESTALRVSASFGGGIGRMRMVCGAASGMFMLAGMQNGSNTPHDAEGKKQNYAFVQELAAEFKNVHGTLICAEMLGMTNPDYSATQEFNDPTPAQRNEQYYHKRPCVEIVENAVRIYLNAINKNCSCQ